MTVLIWRVAILSPILSASLLCGADLSSYRGFTLGSDLETAAKQAGLKPSDAQLTHERPAVIQQIELRHRAPFVADPPKQDPVDSGVLYFLNGKLSRIVAIYDRYQIKGMTAEDMVDSISSLYGVPSRPNIEIEFHSYYGESARVLARWQDANYSVDLVRTGNQNSFALVLYSKTLDAQARVASMEASRLDELDAPRKAKEEEIRRLEAERVALEQARAESLANFRP